MMLTAARFGRGKAFLPPVAGVSAVATMQVFEKIVQLAPVHWDDIEAYCHEEHNVPLSFVEGLNNKTRFFLDKFAVVRVLFS
jgi:hypothetical protein